MATTSLNGAALLLVHISVVAMAVFCQPANAIGQEVIDNICNQSEDYRFCFNALDKDPRTAAAGVEGVCLITVSITIDQVGETAGKISELLKNVTDAVDKQRMLTCQSNYAAAAADFQNAWTSASNKKFNDVLSFVQKGANEVINCQNIYRQSSPVRESPFSVGNHNAIKLSGMTLIVLGMLGAR